MYVKAYKNDLLQLKANFTRKTLIEQIQPSV